MSAISRNNVQVSGDGATTMMFAHGFGCDQNMWRLLQPVYAQRCRTITFDHTGSGSSDLSAYDREKYGTLNGYATDVLEILEEVGGGPHFRRSFCQRHDWHAREHSCAEDVRGADHGRSVSLLHQ